MDIKFRRISQACDNCSSRRVRCRQSLQQPKQCQNCADYGEECTYSRPQRKRGAKLRRHLFDSISSKGSIDVLPKTNSAAIKDLRSPHANKPNSQDKWSPSLIINQALVFDLVEVYLEVVYPIFPLFHPPALQRRVSRGEHMSNRPLYALVMAICALSSARSRDGAVYLHSSNRQSLADPPSEILYDAARSALELESSASDCLDYMRAAVLLSITAIQYGNARSMNFFLGIYHTYVDTGGLHDEDNWPSDLSRVEIQERRRVFWSAYTLDVFTAIVWNGTVRSRESSSNVSYPEPIEDEIPQSPTTSVHWLLGWNFVTDLYRILEHAVDHLHRLRNPLCRTPEVFGTLDDHFSRAHVTAHVVQMYTALPAELKSIHPACGDLAKDLFGFQAANIQATVQLVRMVYLINDDAPLDEKCRVASEVIAGFRDIPVAYLRAISTPLQHHLGEIGAIFGAAFKRGMTESSYRTAGEVLLDLAQLLETLESGLCFPTGTGNKLRSQIARIDAFMSSERPTDGLETSLESADLSPLFHFPSELIEDWFGIVEDTNGYL